MIINLAQTISNLAISYLSNKDIADATVTPYGVIDIKYGTVTIVTLQDGTQIKVTVDICPPEKKG